MGNVVNEFVCVEFEMPPSTVAALKERIAACEWKESFNVSLGNNNYVFFTAAPSGSKEGWGDNKQHREELNTLLGWIREESCYCLVKRVTTSGDNHA